MTAVVVISFVGSIVYAGRIASAIDGMAYDFGGNAAPSVQYLSGARTQLFSMVSTLAGAFVDPTRRAEVRPAIEQAHVRLQQKLDARGHERVDHGLQRRPSTAASGTSAVTATVESAFLRSYSLSPYLNDTFTLAR